MQELILDSTISSALYAAKVDVTDDSHTISRTVSGISTKIHVMTYAVGNKIEIFLSEGYTHYCKVANVLKNVYTTKVTED
ncbi:hypothetical protein IFN73_10810 [Francisella tularensis subsp. holarctica]|nr:hypothetical protein [Francisella tularensis subsp. holarctica]